MLAGFNSFSQCPGSKVPCKKTDCKSGKVSATQKTTQADVEVAVYYFHNSARCATCIAVEKETVNALKELYPDKYKEGKIVFTSFDIEDEANAKLVKENEVAGQTLLIIGGDKKINLTNDAFMYAKTKPEKLKKKIQEAIKEIV